MGSIVKNGQKEKYALRNSIWKTVHLDIQDKCNQVFYINDKKNSASITERNVVDK